MRGSSTAHLLFATVLLLSSTHAITAGLPTRPAYPRGSSTAHLLLATAVLLSHTHAVTAGLPTLPDADELLQSWQDLLLQGLWEQHRDRMSFCLGGSLPDVKQLLHESFPSPLPTGPADDPVCSDGVQIKSNLCGPQELQFYFHYLLLTDNPEKLPDNNLCAVGGTSLACSPGFFQTRASAAAAAAATVPDLQGDQPHACCPGYICPSMLTCLIPCPLGAHCPRAWPWDPPTGYLAAAAASDSQGGGLLPPALTPQQQEQPAAAGDKWCAPYAYKMRSQLGCGGADKWRIEPSAPFPRRWDWFSGSIFCSGGKFCPNTTAMLDCPPGHFCKAGSSKATLCPPLLGCPANTETPTDNLLGVVLNGAMFLLLALTWQAMQLYHQLVRRLSRRERMKLMWNRQKNAPEITVVEDDKDSQPYGCAPPPTARQTAAGGHPAGSSSLSAGAATAAAAAAAVAAEHAAGRSGGWQLGFRFFGRVEQQLARRRSSRAGAAAGGSTGDAIMTWASLDDSSGAQFNAPLLQYDMQEQAEELHVVQHRRTLSDEHGTGIAVQPQQLLPALKAKIGRISLESQQAGGHDLIAAGVHTALSPASIRDTLGSEASSGARFSSNRRSNSVSADGSGWGSADSAGGDGPGGRPQAFEAVAAPRLRLDVGFEGLVLKLKSCGKEVLQGVTGRLQHGRLAAVMGPSGAGKTSLLSVLAGRAPYATASGRVTINGRPGKLEKFKRQMGFVPQHDIMYRNLSVEENLTYSACFRLPASTTPRQRLQVVAAAIDVLGLDDVRHQLIGNEEVRGISGGQVKRVNVGLELVAEPSLLFLDEPTSGLDSTASKQVVQCLQRVAHTGVTVAAVIHQPSWECFCLFDDLILLAKGGLSAFAGAQDQVQGYFEGLGFEIPAHMNPADAYLDIVAGAIQPSSGAALDIAACWQARQAQQGAGASPIIVPGSRGGGAVTSAVQGLGFAAGVPGQEAQVLLEGCPEQGAAVVAIAASRRTSQQGGQQAGRRWRRHMTAVLNLPRVLLLGLTLLITDFVDNAHNAVAEQLQSWAAVIAAHSTAGGSAHAQGDSGRGGQQRAGAADRRPPGFAQQYRLVLGRAALMRTREPFLVFIEYSIYAVTGMFVGLMSDRGRGNIQSYVGNVVYTIVAMGMLSTISGVKVHGGPDRLVFYREASTGLSKLAYFLALDTWSLVGMVLRCAAYLISYQTTSQPRAVVWQLYVVTCAIYYSCQGQAFLLSQVMGSNAAQLTAAVSALINALVASKFSQQGALGLMNRLSYARWGLEAYVISETSRLKGVWLLSRCADLAAFSYDVTRFWYAIKVLLYIGLGSRVAACLAMLTLHRDKSL